MREPPSPDRRSTLGYSLIEVLITVAILFILVSLGIPMYINALRQSRESALAADCRKLHTAMMSYHADNGAFPADADFDTATLSPLSEDGYFVNPESLTQKIDQNELTVYLAPDIGGVDQQFITVVRHRHDPQVIVAAVYTNMVTDDGTWVDGVYIITEDDLADAGF
jgi:Tfp pilus assembly protein PilE